MGADGGSIPTREDLVKTKTKTVLNKDAVIQRRAILWRTCSMSGEPLSIPIVACKKGRLYNKESILKHLLALKKTGKNDNSHPESDVFDHIKSLKDVISLDLTKNPIFESKKICSAILPLSSSNKKPTRSQDELLEDDNGGLGPAPFVCPLSGKEMNGRFPFVYLKGCGCAMSLNALEELEREQVKSNNKQSGEVLSSNCPNCGKSRKLAMNDRIALTVMMDFTEDEVNLIKQEKKLLNIDSERSRKRAIQEKDYLSDEHPQPLRIITDEGSYLRKIPAVSSLYKR